MRKFRSLVMHLLHQTVDPPSAKALNFKCQSHYRLPFLCSRFGRYVTRLGGQLKRWWYGLRYTDSCGAEAGTSSSTRSSSTGGTGESRESDRTMPCYHSKEVDQMNGLKLLFHLQPGNSATGPLPETTHNASDRNKASALLSSPKRPSLPSDGAI